MPPRKSTKRKLESSPALISKEDASAIISQLLKSHQKYYDKFTKEVARNDKLVPLDKWRNEFPETLKERYNTDPKSLLLTKPELIRLMDWKLTKGKFRPTLFKLLNQNSEESIETATKDGFAQFLELKDSEEVTKDEYLTITKKSIQTLSTLRGIGPATASLMLSLLSSITNLAPPFFSDESAEWTFVKIRGTEVEKLKYSIGEYMEYVEWWFDLIGPKFKECGALLEQGAWCERLKDLGMSGDDDDDIARDIKKQKTE
ncbi:CYFA0S02e01464g1_1 [Cyberlindnera fabianii]|uniref:CYFA0S02e01464g1_1 n=1 Tax=Cyberlindnera fabianii TaxID=36022 RepID=A0A061ALJ5_CYBFA|nr:hypothetical protein BON22_4086 [Cyberlindnera fabianii]CDR38420.1 CYFA0S02e01464g1_1 [Cyberlindnera fabianii]